MKYRIIKRHSLYFIQKKGWFFWNYLSRIAIIAAQFNSLEEAKEYIIDLHILESEVVLYIETTNRPL